MENFSILLKHKASILEETCTLQSFTDITIMKLGFNETLKQDLILFFFKDF